jgi:hypothetical protein
MKIRAFFNFVEIKKMSSECRFQVFRENNSLTKSNAEEERCAGVLLN